jgi:hypothetical protein
MTNNQIVKLTKSNLPTKSTVAACLLITAGMAWTILWLLFILLSYQSEKEYIGPLFTYGSIGTVCLIIPGMLLFLRRRLAWIVTVLILCAEITCISYIYTSLENRSTYGTTALLLEFILPLVFLTINLFLIVLDWKNYSEMVRQRGPAKKEKDLEQL